MKKFIMIATGLVMLTTAACSNPFKVTDPSDPKFNPDNFSFSDYKTREELGAAFRQLFPVGTEKEFVERVLVKAGGAEAEAQVGGVAPHDYLQVRYTEPYLPWRQFKEAAAHIFMFKPNGRLVNVHVFLGGKLYEDEKGWKEFYNLNGGQYE